MNDHDTTLAAAISFHDAMVDRFHANRQADADGAPRPVSVLDVVGLEPQIDFYRRQLQPMIAEAFEAEIACTAIPAPHPIVVANNLGSTWRMLLSAALGSDTKHVPAHLAAA